MAGEGSADAMELDAAPVGFNPENRYRFPFHEAELEQIKLLLTKPDDDEDINSEEEYCDLGEDILIDDNYEYDVCDIDTDQESDDDEERDQHQEEWLQDRPDTTVTAANDRYDEPRIPPGINTPYDYFKLLFTEELLQDIVSATNKCAADVLSKTPYSDKWTELDVEEFRTFLGLVIYMGIVRAGGITDYWKPRWFCPEFAVKCMPRNRFLAIFRFLKFGKENVNSLINHFNDTMSALFIPGTDLFLDESLILRQGRGDIEQCIQGKRNKYGVELNTLVTASGVVVYIHMCQGRRDAEADGIKRRDKVVIKLMAKFLNAGHHLLLPDYFTSVSLANFLLKNNTHLTGRLRKHRQHNPKIVVESKLNKGDSIYSYTQNGVCVCKWRGSHNTLMISTKWSPKLVPVVNKGRKIIKMPEMVGLFDDLLNRVVDDDDEEDSRFYALEFKGMRWYKKVGIHILQIMFSNAFYLYKKHKNLNLNFYSYRKRLMHALLPILRTSKHAQENDSSSLSSDSDDSMEGCNTSSLEFDSSGIESESSSSQN